MLQILKPTDSITSTVNRRNIISASISLGFACHGRTFRKPFIMHSDAQEKKQVVTKVVSHVKVKESIFPKNIPHLRKGSALLNIMGCFPRCKLPAFPIRYAVKQNKKWRVSQCRYKCTVRFKY